jgi:sugar diacid utilization regulator/GAF domain-containing protein
VAAGQPASEEITAPPAAAVLELRSWLDAIARISAAVNNMEPLVNVLNAISATTARLLGYDFGAVLLADDDRLLIRGSFGLTPAYIATFNTEKPMRLGHGPFGEAPAARAFRSHHPVIVRDSLHEPSLEPWAGVVFEQGWRSLAALPLIIGGRSIGTLAYYTRNLHEFSEDEVLLLATIANQAAIAIEAARLREQERATIIRLEEARRSLEIQARVLERSEEIHTQLTRAVLEDAGLTAISEALTKVLHGAVVIDDPAGTVLASAKLDAVPAVVPRSDDPEFGTLVAESVAAQEPREFSPLDHPAFERRTFIAPIVIAREIVGRLWVIGASSALEALERRALEHGVTVVALELLKLRIASEVERRLRGELLDDLLAGRGDDRGALRGRAQHLKHDLGLPHAAIVVALDAPHGDAGATSGPRRTHQLLQIVLSAIRRMHLDALVGERERRIVVLLAARDVDGVASRFADLVRRDVRTHLAEATATVGVGPWVAEVEGFPRSYRIARGALELAQHFGQDRTLSVDSLGVYGLLLAVDRLDELAAFSRRALDPLRQYDRRKGTDLVATLRAFLAHSCRTADTSAALTVHPNTVAYRIRRIESLLGVDLSRPEAQLHLQLALIVDDTIGARRVAAVGAGGGPAGWEL